MEEVLNNQVTETTNNEVTDTSVKESVEAKVYSQEEFDKAVQSAASKAKYEILKALDLKSVDAYKERISEYDAKIKDYDSMKTANENYKEQVNKLNIDLAVERLNVAEEHKDDLITLAKAKAVDGKTFDVAAKEILDKNVTWLKASETVKIGTPKSTADNNPNKPSKELLERYPWLG